MEIAEQRNESIWFLLIGVIAGISIGWIAATNFRSDDSHPVEEQFSDSKEKSVLEEVEKEGEKSKSRRVLVVSEKDAIMKGETYSAEVIVADVDTTLQYKCQLNTKELESNKIQFICCALGKFQYQGLVRVTETDGTVSEYPFSKEYTVTEPCVSISSSFLLKGKENLVSVSAFGIPSNDINISVTNAQCKKTASGYLLNPIPGATTCLVTASAQINGRNRIIAKREFQVVE
ncbi:MAG: hypothetical protein J6Y37_00185 [Paludibacteraceae bacterium]|nr:hypothetical protein [Paludibacteraceae bacterium]